MNIESLFEGLTEETIDFLMVEKDLLTDALTLLSHEKNIAPELVDVFKAFRLCPVEKTKVVLIGQDPFPAKKKNGKPVATGLCYSTDEDVAIQPSTKNIYKCLIYNKLMEEAPKNGDLSNWAAEGVLMLNAILTTRIGESSVHDKIWLPYTKKLITQLYSRGVPFIALGEVSKKLLLSAKVSESKIHYWGHPSPLNRANKTDNPANFMYADVFNKVNEALHVPINWDPRKSRENAVEVSQIRVVPINKTNIPRITVFTDGAATANGRANCRASYGYYITGAELDVRKADIVSNAEIRGEKYSSSNNRGELSAIYHATQYLVENIKGSDIEIVSDSQYSINCIEVWAHRWLADPVKHSLSEKKNMDIIKPTLDNIVVIQKSNVLSFKHIRSHKNAPLDKNSQEWFYWNGNDIADKLCTTVLKKNV